MAWEEAFGIKISDAEAERITTPRMAIDLIHSKLGGALRGDGHCLTQRGFYRLRQAILPLVSVHRRSMTPHTRLTELIPKDRRKEVWRSFQSAVDFAVLPHLNRPAWCHWSLGGLFAGSFACSLYWLYNLLAGWGKDELTLSIIPSLFLAGVALWHGLKLTCPLRTEFSVETFGDLTRWVVADRPLAIKERDQPWSREDVAVVVRKIIKQQLGIEHFSDDADFVRDLGVG